MKRVGRIGCVVICLLFLFIAGASSDVTLYARVLLPDVSIYKETSLSSEVLDKCKQNEEVVIEKTLEVNGEKWCKVLYNDTISGYIPADMLYSIKQYSSIEQVKIFKISPKKMGEKVPLYRVVHDEPTLFLGDGVSVTKLETTADYGNYSLVEYDGENYFIETKYLTDTLTLSQKLAMIVAAVMIGIIVISLFIFLAIRKRRLNKK